ncbi:MAG: DUF2027 domain-containing protein [Cyclobacteriaceae bacterium]|nr:DUF2027 domain-containing protein [Cyclobacteriaceae bacterium]
MRIGDRVRLLRGTEEGRIVGLRGKIVDVEIEDGFVIPTLMNEIVKIDKHEAQTFQREAAQESREETAKKNDDFITEGIYLGLEELRESNFEAFIINQTTHTILYSISQYDKKQIRSIAFGICEPFQRQSVGALTSSIFNDSKRLLIQLLVHEEESRLKKQPVHQELDIKPAHLGDTIYLATLEKQLSLINLENPRPLQFNPEELREKMLSKSQAPAFKEKVRGSKQLVVDLHMDEHTSSIKRNEILGQQLIEFEKAYDKALAEGAEKLLVIHGLGAGILRNEIHKRLSSKKEVKYFEDANKERFGFGSTAIYF